MGGQTEMLPPKSGWSVKLIFLFFFSLASESVAFLTWYYSLYLRTYFAFKTSVVAAWLRDSSKDLISCRPTILLSPYRQYVVVHILPPLTACP